jgi:hypothetical protein
MSGTSLGPSSPRACRVAHLLLQMVRESLWSIWVQGQVALTSYFLASCNYLGASAGLLGSCDICPTLLEPRPRFLFLSRCLRSRTFSLLLANTFVQIVLVLLQRPGVSPLLSARFLSLSQHHILLGRDLQSTGSSRTLIGGAQQLAISMASAHAHPASQTMTVEHGRSGPSLPTLTDPDLLLPIPETASSYNQYRGSSFLTSDTELSPSSSTGVLSPLSTESFELGTAKTFLMPLRPKPAPPLSNLLAYSGYEHGAPLSDIGEEETTPKSKRARSRTPSPTTSSPTIAPQSSGWLGQNSQKRLSGMSNSSGISTGSDLHWEGFDTRAGISDRLRADLAAAVDDTDDFGSRRHSTATNGDEENTTQALSERAEQILANAKKRLTVRLLRDIPCFLSNLF